MKLCIQVPQNNFTIMAMFTPKALKLPKIAQNRHEWYFQNPLTFSFPKSFNFLILAIYSIIYSTPANNLIDFFEYIPFCKQKLGQWTPSSIRTGLGLKLLGGYQDYKLVEFQIESYRC